MHLRDAVIAVEGEDFYTEGGRQPRSILRAAYTNISSGEVEEGGSTITQQYVKKIYTDGEPNARAARSRRRCSRRSSAAS